MAGGPDAVHGGFNLFVYGNNPDDESRLPSTLDRLKGLNATSLAIAFTGRSTSAYLLFYLWVALYAFYFLSGPQTAILCLFAIVNYALVILGSRVLGYTAGGLDANEDIPAFVLMSGTFAVAGVFLVTLRERVARLTEKGLGEALPRVHAPVGLNLGGRAPAEIAVSILAQIVQVRHRQVRHRGVAS